MKRIKLVLFLMHVLTLSVFAQDYEVKGVVTDKQDNLPLVGVNVVIKGTTQGVVTDVNGNYQLKVPSGAVLQFSFIGYASQETSYPLAQPERRLPRLAVRPRLFLSF